tara:strand:- start:938 stop:1564 length:627 start_codon:yes stop_codon:yes gene_type:complete
MKTRNVLFAALALFCIFLVLEEFAFRITWQGSPDHGASAAWVAGLAMCAYFGPLTLTYWPSYLLDTLWVITIFLIGLVLCGVDFRVIKAPENGNRSNQLPVLIMHLINLLCALLFDPDLKLSFIVPPVIGVLIQSVWYHREQEGEFYNCGTKSHCRHRVEYYSSFAFVAAIYIAVYAFYLSKTDNTVQPRAKPVKKSNFKRGLLFIVA